MSRLLARLGRFSARRRVFVLIAWFAVIIAFGATALSGMKFSDDGFDVPGTASSEAMTVLEEEFPSDGEDLGSLQLVVKATDSQEITSPALTNEVQESISEISGLDGVSSVSDPFDAVSPRISENLTTAVATIEIDTGVDAESITAQIQGIAEDNSSSDVVMEVGGSIVDATPEILGPTEIVGAVVAFLVLVLTYGSLVAAGANMLGALVGVGVGILGVLGFSAFTPIGSLTPILAVMLGLAVGIDYCLFILARFRSELRAGREVHDAIGIAVGTAGTSVVFAGSTVIVALSGLLVVGIPFLGEMGLAAAFAVLVAVLMSLTLLPALLSLMGRSALPRQERNLDSPNPPVPSRFIDTWGEIVTKHRVLSVIGGVALLSVLSIPVLSMTTALSTPGGEDPNSSQRAAYDIVSEEFGAGTQDPIVVLAQNADVSTKIPEVQEAIASVSNVDMVIPSGVAASSETAMFTVMSKYGPLDQRTEQLVHDLREVEIENTEVLVTGVTAIGIDSNEQLQSALINYLIIIVGFSLLLLIVLFRSILVPIIATLGFLLSLGAGLGATVAVFQWGWLDPLFTSPQGNPLLSLLPIVVTGILFGLAMDYQVFLVSRMHEAHEQGLEPKEAILQGFRSSAIVVVAAALIMTAVFGGFAVSPSSLVGSIALALTVGVVADAFIVRMIITPALLALLGNAAWWIPKWLNRLLPTIDAEGSSLNQESQDSTELNETDLSEEQKERVVVQ